DLFECITTESSRLAAYNKLSTISSRDIQTVTRLVLPPGLTPHTISAGNQATTSYSFHTK
ncbi:uncharacterized protein HMPREF1541_00002, partial [Cyphellophora europaea CBS 101466]